MGNVMNTATRQHRDRKRDAMTAPPSHAPQHTVMTPPQQYPGQNHTTAQLPLYPEQNMDPNTAMLPAPQPAHNPNWKRDNYRRLADTDAIATEGSSTGLMVIFIALLFLLYAFFANRQRRRASKQRVATKPIAGRAEPKIQV